MSFTPDQIRGQLERMLASPGFVSADRASRFLRYVVLRALAGEGDQLKEYVIGREVFDRGEEYDPRTDSIVRVEAGRLRSKVDEYYSGPGRADALRIQLRRGGYAPAFEPHRPAAAAPRPRGRLILGLAAAALVVVALVAWRAGIGATVGGTPAQTIAVLPFSNYSTDPEERLLAARVTDGVTSELARLGTLGVVSHTSALQFADVHRSVREIAQALGAQLVLEGKVRVDAGTIVVQVRLVDASVDRKVWVQDISGQANDIPELERQIARATSVAAIQRRQ